MIYALRGLQRLYEPEAVEVEARQHPSFQAFKISGARGGLLSLFATHPPLEERIARLEQGTV
jgi:heat shock protein HtpX